MKKGCEFCKADKNDKFKHIFLVSGSWISMYISFDENEIPFIYASAEDDTDRYYFKYCPNCGRKIED